MFSLLPTTAAGPATGPPESSPNDHAISDTQGRAFVDPGFGPGHSLRPPVDRTWTYPTVETMGRRYTARTAGSRTHRVKVANLRGRAEKRRARLSLHGNRCRRDFDGCAIILREIM
jgi:hypothetical protein